MDSHHDIEAQNSYRPLPPAPYLTGNNLQNSQRPKRCHDVLIHALQPFLLKRLLAACYLNRGLQVLADERNQIDPMHRVRVNEFAPPHILRRLGLRGELICRGGSGPVEAASIG